MWNMKCFLVLILSLISCVYSTRHDVHEMMYRTFDSTPACFRRLNGTHQFGCSSPRGGSYGVIHFIRNHTDLSEFLSNGVAGPYAIVLTPLLFKRSIIDSLISSDKVSGLVLNTATAGENLPDPLPSLYSPDDVCPNRYSLVDNTCDIAWNSAANSFLFHDWPFPVFLVNKLEDYTAISDCHDKFNPPLDESQLSRPLCSLHLKSHMHAAVDSETCLRRINYYGVKPTKYCDAVGDENVILPTLKWQENDNNNIILIGARMDALSLFDGIAPGAMSSATGIVTLITTAYIFHKMITQNEINQNNNKVGVVFALFNGEAYDFVGSSRIVYDMHQGVFPSRNNRMNLSNIRLFIELYQLSSNQKVYVHHTVDKESADFMNYLNNTFYDVIFENSKAKQLPPASFQSFYKADKNLSGAILSNFDESFVDSYYNSIYDNAGNINYFYANGSFNEKLPIYDLQYRLAGISHILATYLYKKAFNDKEPPPLQPGNKSVELVDELLHCYIETRKCRLMNEVGAVASDKVPDLPPLYVGVRNNPENYLARVTGYILAYLTGKKLSITREHCVNDETQKDYSLFWMNGESGKGECINSSLLFTPAESPAFIIPQYDWKSGLYSTWTESVWSYPTLGLFIKPFRLQEIIVLSSGLLVLILSFTTVFWVNKKAGSLFMSTTPTSC